jgi:uncharacterized NAD(P)/FAD-binding protein YdhS
MRSVWHLHVAVLATGTSVRVPDELADKLRWLRQQHKQI